MPADLTLTLTDLGMVPGWNDRSDGEIGYEVYRGVEPSSSVTVAEGSANIVLISEWRNVY